MHTRHFHFYEDIFLRPCFLWAFLSVIKRDLRLCPAGRRWVFLKKVEKYFNLVNSVSRKSKEIDELLRLVTFSTFRKFKVYSTFPGFLDQESSSSRGFELWHWHIHFRSPRSHQTPTRHLGLGNWPCAAKRRRILRVSSQYQNPHEFGFQAQRWA